MGRLRQPENFDLPDNLRVENKINGKTYFHYELPDGRWRSLGQDREAAVVAANALNVRLAPAREEIARNELIKRMEDPLLVGNPPLSAVIAEYKNTKMDSISDQTAYNYTKLLDIVDLKLGKRKIQDVRTYHLAQMLKPRTDNSRRAFRNVLIKLWRFAKSEGYTDENPVSDIEAVTQPKRIRQRHTWDGFQLTLDQCEPWLAHTALLALYSLQRRVDLVQLQWPRVDLIKRTLFVRQQKTGATLEIQMGTELFDVINYFHTQPDPRTGNTMDCPYVVHRRPKVRTQRLMDAVREGRQHMFQVMPNTLTGDFRDARNASGAYGHLPVRERPAFHDIRALGIFALWKAGYSEEYIQALAGHADIEMTRHYMQGHEQVRPVLVEAGLSVKDVEWDKVDWNERLTPALQAILDEDDSQE